MTSRRSRRKCSAHPVRPLARASRCNLLGADARACVGVCVWARGGHSGEQRGYRRALRVCGQCTFAARARGECTEADSWRPADLLALHVCAGRFQHHRGGAAGSLPVVRCDQPRHHSGGSGWSRQGVPIATVCRVGFMMRVCLCVPNRLLFLSPPTHGALR